MNLSEHDYEPVPGLPADLPEGERLLWQGAPLWWPLARRAYRVTWVAAYFAALALWHGTNTWRLTHQLPATAKAVGIPLLLAAFVIGLLGLLAWFSARATLYSITNHRLVIRHGISLPLTLNLPFSKVVSADLCVHADGTGELALKVTRQQRIGYVLNWPHVRPGHYLQPQPALRALPEARRAAQILGDALLASLRNGGTSKAAAPAPTEAITPLQRPAPAPRRAGTPSSAAA